MGILWQIGHHLRPLPGGEPGQVLPLQQTSPAPRPPQHPYGGKEGGLAGAVGTKQPQEGPLRQPEGDLPKHRGTTIIEGEMLHLQSHLPSPLSPNQQEMQQDRYPKKGDHDAYRDHHRGQNEPPHRVGSEGESRPHHRRHRQQAAVTAA